MEQLGAEGNVEESQKVMDEVEKARAKKREAEVMKFFIELSRALLSVLNIYLIGNYWKVKAN